MTVAVPTVQALPAVQSFDYRIAGHRHPYARFGKLLPYVLAAYLLFDRAAAYLHIPGTPVYMAEALLAIGLWAFLRNPSLTWMAVRDDALLSALGAWFLWGLVHTICGLGFYGATWVVRDSALWYYSLFAVFVASAALSVPDLPQLYARQLARFTPWLLCWLPLAVVLGVAAHISTTVPFSTVSVLSHKDGNLAVAAFLALTGMWLLPGPHLSESARRWWSLLAVSTVLMAGTQNRGGMVATTFAVAVGLLVVRGMARRAAKAVSTLALVAILLGVLFPHIGTHSSRSIGPSQLLANVESLAGIDKANSLQGTEQARQRQWSYVLDLEANEGKLLSGWGPGPNLGFGAATGTGNDTLRVPHNSHMDVLARLGLIGSGLWVLLWGAWVWRLAKSRRLLTQAGLHLRRNAVEVCLLTAIAILVNAFFDPSLEGAQVAALLWTLFGLGAVLSNPRWCPVGF